MTILEGRNGEFMSSAMGKDFSGKIGENIQHKIILEQRQQGTISGVIDVVAFNTEEIILETSCGGIIIKGKELHIQSIDLTKTDISLSGNVDSIVYTRSKKKREGSFIKRLFA